MAEPTPECAMILAAGLGLRMRPLTETKPKPLVPVAGQPLIAHNLLALDRAGIGRVVVNNHHLSDQIREFASGWLKQPISLSDETDRLLDSGGGIKKALPLLGATPFFVLNADSFWIDGPRSNLARLAEAWRPETMDILLLLASHIQATGYDALGDFMMGPDGRLIRRSERQVAPFIYAGVALMKPALFDDTTDGPFSLNLLFDRAIALGRLFGLRLDGWWLHVGTPDAIAQAEDRIARSIL